jgi:hypothetical protein
MFRWVPCLPLYRVRGQGVYKAIGSPDRGVESLREGLPNLACKLRHLVGHVQAWLLSWSCGHVAAWCYYAGRGGTVGMMVVRQPSCATWSPPWSSSSSPGFLGRCTRVGGRPQVVDHLVVLKSGGPQSLSLGSWFPRSLDGL